MAVLTKQKSLSCQAAVLVSYMKLRRRRNKSKRRHKFLVREIFLQRQEPGQFHTLFQELKRAHHDIYRCFMSFLSSETSFLPDPDLVLVIRLTYLEKMLRSCTLFYRLVASSTGNSNFVLTCTSYPRISLL